ncbi:alternate F1F0 ATPase, F1 subunit alpha [Salidesulfovibrio onnuriiensis]|uniref:alternate F1F0 ATPase, F1 subunit alpha n=1 Tax=Salidesulfovibrio onnuriiensis TaxID=2583823 RepID=UPI0011C74BB3|nr:alternate F1F0 ATPase, F1 subunit alpha [Salidesulfovibrio onnuriiensis]
MSDDRSILSRALGRATRAVDSAASGFRFRPGMERYGSVASIGSGVARIKGLSGVMADELLEVGGSATGMALDVDHALTGAVLLRGGETVQAGTEARRTGRVADVPVGEGLLGRVVDALGAPLDGRGPVREDARLPVERPAPPIMDRDPVQVPMQTGLKVVDALIPVGRGQRELILGDRQTGKTSIALDTIINQRGRGVICVYCAIGKRGSSVGKVVQELRENDALEYTTVVVSTEEDAAGMQFLAPYAATSMAEYFMEQGRDTLIVYDDLTRHARAYRELSLLLRRPPGREAFPGDIFYIHSRLLERSTHLKQEHGGGSLTALPVVETEAQNLSAYIPTNLISITDGQIYLSPILFRKGILPAVDVGKSVSRVGGKTQLRAYRAVAGDLRLTYSQFEELEVFSRFGTRLDDDTRQKIERGRRVREILKQPRSSPLTAAQQVFILLALGRGVFDGRSVEGLAEDQGAILERLDESLAELAEAVLRGDNLEEADMRRIVDEARAVLWEPEG